MRVLYPAGERFGDRLAQYNQSQLNPSIGAELGHDVARVDPLSAIGADERGVHAVAAGLVQQCERRTGLTRHPPVAPSQQGDDHRVQITTLLGETVLEPRRLLLIAHLFEDARGN